MNGFQAILKKESTLRDVYGINFLDLKVLVNISGSYEWHEWKVLRRSTGLEDKNGEEIYEGDVVKCGLVGKIIYDCAGFYIQFYNQETDNYIYNSIGYYKNNIPPNDLEILGNIYDNPEILK